MGWLSAASVSREAHIGEHIMLGLVHEPGRLLEAGPELIGNVAPDVGGGFGIGLDEGLADGGGNDGVLAFADMGKGKSERLS